MAFQIDNCSWQFKIQCPLTWESLSPGEDEATRVCGVCLNKVYRCETDEEVAFHASQGRCVAILTSPNDPDESVDLLGLVDF